MSSATIDAGHLPLTVLDQFAVLHGTAADK
jgi:hypothetical protein